MASLRKLDDASRWTPRHWTIVAALLALYALFRLPHLRDLPVFCDEATYLRWAQLIHADPLRNLWVSMQDAKLPLHYWLLALVFPTSAHADPIYIGRLLSVCLGAITLLLLFPLADELCRLRPRPNPASNDSFFFASILALFMITSPLVATYQRLALAEPLLLLESVALAWFSLRFARLLSTPETPTRVQVKSAILLGLLWSLALLTKQNFSYLLWILPPLAIALHCKSSRQILRRFLPLYALATAIGLLLFIPALFASSTLPLSVRLFYKATFTSSATLPRWSIFLWNLISLVSPRVNQHAQWWPHNPHALLDDGSLYLYLTPPLFPLLLAGALFLVYRRSILPLLFFATWTAALLGALALNSNVIRTRYAFVGIVPLLLLAAWIAAELLAALRRQSRPFATGALRILFLLALLAWPAAATTTQLLDYNAPTCLSMDRSEYIAACSAGAAAQQAVHYLAASHEPVTLITATGFGLPNDLPWLLLRNQKNIQLLCTDQPLSPDRPILLGTEQWYPARTAPILLPPAKPIYQIIPMSPNHAGQLACIPALSTYGPHARLITTFLNPPPHPGDPPISALALIRLDPPPVPRSLPDPSSPPCVRWGLAPFCRWGVWGNWVGKNGEECHGNIAKGGRAVGNIVKMGGCDLVIW